MRLGKFITDKTGLETRTTVLGHIQRGGRPTAQDRILASKLGNHAVNVLKNDVTDHCVIIKNSELMTIPLDIAIKPKKIEVDDYFKLIKLLT